MEEEWMASRSKLRQLLTEYPTWSNRQYAEATGRSRRWVQKWKVRLSTSDPDDPQMLCSQSRARKTPHGGYSPRVIERILALRDQPPLEVPRLLGPLAIAYYLHQDETLQQKEERLPQSGTTIWKILDRHQRILRPRKRQREPFERPAPMDTWEIDFTDVSTAQADHDHKRHHQVEAFAVVDRGTSILVDLQVSDDYQASSAILAMASTLLQNGLPRCIVMDRDPRLVGSWSSQEFPSAFMRFLLTLGIALEVCPPQRPDRKPFVERYFRTFTSECVNVQRPATVMQARQLVDDHRYSYNHARPNQAMACGNRPPYVAFPALPPLPPLPYRVDPDRWLQHYHHRIFKRRITRNGTLQIDKQHYYIQQKLAGQDVACQVDAHQRVFEVFLRGQRIKTLPIKGLCSEEVEFGEYLELMMKEAETEYRRLERQRLRRIAAA